MYACLVILAYYNTFGNGRQVFGIPMVTSLHTFIGTFIGAFNSDMQGLVWVKPEVAHEYDFDVE